eukprot:Rhum_TRINITY_DN8938_c0_g1::Rhum_TRINITY_DN8938_c0_g1_i1::g.30747::m.30747
MPSVLPRRGPTVVAVAVAAVASLVLFEVRSLSRLHGSAAATTTTSSSSSSPPPGAVRYPLGICASVKDDAHWLVEWLEFHALVGVRQFYIIDDGSTDATPDILRHYADVRGLVTLVPGPVPDGDRRCRHTDRRDSAYVAMCYDHAAPHLDWMAIIDTDEFLFPRSGCNAADYVASTCNALATHVVLYWEMFGSSGLRLHPHGLLAESFLTSGGDCAAYADEWGPTCAPFAGNCKECRHTKYLANTGACLQAAEHCANHLPERLQLAPSKCDAQPDGVDACLRWWALHRQQQSSAAAAAAPAPPTPRYVPECCGAGLALHHYAPKSEEAQLWRARRRMRNGLMEDRDHSPGAEKRDLNWVLSPGILKYVGTLRTRVAAAHARLWPGGDAQRRARLPPGHPVLAATSPDVSVSADSPCFVERGFRYRLRPGEGAVAARAVRGCVSADECCRLCAEDKGGGGCLAFTFHPLKERCTLLRAATPSALKDVWPRGSLPLARTKEDGRVSGVVLSDVC